jgi:sugar O-acyltransferase (sialic acid O-acetyltransferase NeuD family)
VRHPEEMTDATAPTPSWCVVGAGGHARAVVDVLSRLNGGRSGGGRSGGVVGCIADTERLWRGEAGVRVASESEALAWAAVHEAPVVVAIGDNAARLRWVRQAVDRGLSLPPVVAATATVSTQATLAPGVVVMEHAHVGPYAELGDGALVNTTAVVEHDCRVGPGTHLAPGSVLLGHASVGAGCLIGARATVLVGRTVGDGVVVGAGAVVLHDLPGGTTYVGVPARPAGD